MTRLEAVRLSVPEAAEDDVKCVLAAVGELPQLQGLRLVGRAFGSNMKTLVEAMVDRGRLRELTLDNTPIDDGAGHLAAVLERNRSLSALILLSCRVGDAGMERLGRALTRNRTLRQLKISGNAFTADGVAGFASMMGDMHGQQLLL